MRRNSIYPHRSVRSFPVSRLRMFTSLGIALLGSSAAAFYGSALLATHCRLTNLILKITGIPSNGSRAVVIFPSLWTATVPDTSFPQIQSSLTQTGFLFALSVATLIAIYRSVALSRSLVVFLMILLCASGAAIFFNLPFDFDAAMYQAIWLRAEILVWILLPWVSIALFLLTLPSFVSALAWALFLQAYAVVWSAVRLGFCLGVFHLGGLLFLPLLWFCLGTLFDVVYIVLFYSLALHLSFHRILGERKS